MSKTATTSKRRKGATHAGSEKAPPDGTFYAAFIMIGVFIVGISVPLLGGQHWREVTVGYVAAMTILVNLYAFRAYLGGKMERWQKALARLPLRCVGFGTKGGKPLEAAHGNATARKMIVISVLTSVVVLMVLALILLPDVRGRVF